jgi:hypothetical protein
MSKNVAIYGEKPGYLANVKNDAAGEFAGGVSATVDAFYLSIRGHRFRVRKDTKEVDLGATAQAVLITARPTISRRYYDTAYSAGGVDTPACHATDGEHPDVTNPVAPLCSKCPYNVFGSVTTPSGKKGKRCQDYKRVIVGLFSKTGEILPVIFDIPPTSLKAPRGQKLSELLFREYVGELNKAGVPPYAVVTTLGFTGAEYPQVSFSFERYLTEEEFAEVEKLRESDEVKQLLYPGGAPIDISANPEPAGPTSAAKKSVDNQQMDQQVLTDDDILNEIENMF